MLFVAKAKDLEYKEIQEAFFGAGIASSGFNNDILQQVWSTLASVISKNNQREIINTQYRNIDEPREGKCWAAMQSNLYITIIIIIIIISSSSNFINGDAILAVIIEYVNKQNTSLKPKIKMQQILTLLATKTNR